jgi:putative acetyltransferase
LKITRDSEASAEIEETMLSEAMTIRVDDLTGSEVATLLGQYLQDVNALAEETYALNLEGLRQLGITVWTIWKGDEIAGCGALKELDTHHAELKSVYTSTRFLRRGVATKLLEHFIAAAKVRGYQRVSLETGTEDYFEPARRFYEAFEFRTCAPFGDYKEDSGSIFMTRELQR